MIYVVGFNAERKMTVNYYSGSFKHEKDAHYFRRLAEISGACKLIFLGESIDLRASVFRISNLSEASLCVPYVWFEGEATPGIELQCPFVNDTVYKEYLSPVQQLPGTFVPKQYLRYVGVKQDVGLEQDAEVIITTTDHPMLYSKKGIFTNFPGQFPPLVLEGMLFSIFKGMPCLYPVDGNPEAWDSQYFAKSGYGRFMTLTTIAEQLCYPFYRYDDKRSVIFYTPFLTETSPGVYMDTIRGIRGDPFGVGIDTLTGVVLS